jgi:hypothetical protein
MIIFEGTQLYAYDGANWNALSGSGGGSGPVLTATQVLTGNGTTNSGVVLSGDATINAGVLKVIGIQGKGISSTAPTTNQVLQFNGTNWVPTTLTGASFGNLTTTTSGLTVTGGTGAVSGAGTTINIQNATTTQPGLLTSSDWNTFNNKVSLGGDLGGTAAAPTIAKIQGSTWPANASGVLTNNGAGTLAWSPISGTGTVTNVTGTAPITVVNNSTTPAISISQASGSTNGFLASADWNTFNNKVSLGGDLSGTSAAPLVSRIQGVSVSATAPTSSQVLQYNGTTWIPTTLPGASFGNLTSTTTGLTITGGTGAVAGSGATVNIQNATTSQPGLLTSADWNTFNNKVNLAGDFGGTSASPTVAKLGGQAYTFPASNAVSGVLTNGGTGTLTWAPVSGFLTSTLPSANIFVGNATNVATATPMSGDATISNTGVLTIGTGKVTSTTILDGTIANADIAAAAAIADTKLATISTAGKVSGSAITSGTIAGTTTISTSGDIATTTGKLSVGGTTTFNGKTYTWPTSGLTAGTFLQTDASGNLIWTTPSLSGTAGGDLSNTYPNPTIANTATTGGNIIAAINTNNGVSKINGTSVSPAFGNQNITTTGAGAATIVGGISAGSSSQFSVNASGNITKVNNLQANFPSVQGTNGSVLTNDGVGNLSWATPSINPPVQVPANTDVFEYTGNSTLRLTINNAAGQYELGKLGSPGSTIFSTNWSTGDTYIAGKLGLGVNPPVSVLDVSGDLHLSQIASAPATTADKLYNLGGSLYWNGTNISGGGGFTTSNTIPKGNGTGLVASSLYDDGNTVNANLNNAAGAGFSIGNNGGNPGLTGRQGLSIGATTSGTENVFGIALNTYCSSSGNNDAIFAIANGSSSRVRGLVGGAYSGTSTNLGVDSYASGSGSSSNFGISTNVNGGASNYGVYNTVYGGTVSNYGVYNSMSGGGSYGIYSTGETYDYFSGNVGIGTSTPNAPLQLGNTLGNRKIVLYDASNNDHQYYGLGVNGGEFRYQIANNSGAAHRFYAGTSSTTSLLQMTIGANGNVAITGSLSKGSGTFKIDHPQDPENKFLYHSFVESPDMMNVYNGNITTETNGEAVVTLPEYFESLNKDFRYQLTVIGDFAQAIVYKKIANNKFVIKTDKPNIEVSWQVTGIRKDPFAEKNRVVPEVMKSSDEKGKYLHPEAYGLGPEKGIGNKPNP